MADSDAYSRRISKQESGYFRKLPILLRGHTVFFRCDGVMYGFGQEKFADFQKKSGISVPHFGRSECASESITQTPKSAASAHHQYLRTDILTLIKNNQYANTKCFEK